MVNDPRNDPYSGYRPDLDQYQDFLETSEIGRGRIPPGFWPALMVLIILGAFMLGIGIYAGMTLWRLLT